MIRQRKIITTTSNKDETKCTPQEGVHASWLLSPYARIISVQVLRVRCILSQPITWAPQLSIFVQHNYITFRQPVKQGWRELVFYQLWRPAAVLILSSWA